MTDIVERLRNYATEDHDRGCHGREYSCSCGYDDQRDALLVEAADTIDRLRAALKEINRMANSLSGPDLVLNSIAREARAALEEKA